MGYGTLPKNAYDYGMGFDLFGRIGFFRYFRPPGMPATVSYAATNFNQPTLNTPTIPDLTNNLYHGYEAARNQFSPTLMQATPGYSQFALMPYNMNNGAEVTATGTTTYPTTPPTMDQYIDWDSPAALPYPFGTSGGSFGNGSGEIVANGYMLGSLNRDEADEMNLYHPGQYDDPFGNEDLEWLYRYQDVDGQHLYSRLAQLAPVSFLANGVKNRRLFSVDSWEPTTYSMSTLSPPSLSMGGVSYLYTSSIGNTTSNGGIEAMSNTGGVYLTTPPLAQRNRRINLNFPLPVSNDPMEPVRQKWIFETYQLMKQMLPQTATDTTYELAQLSQFLVNVIDFRDPDSTVTVFQNPDLIWTPPTGGTPARLAINVGGANTVSVPLVQYGMEYQPIAINEVLAFQFNAKNPQTKADSPNKRFFFELVNTLTQDGTATAAPFSTDLNLNGWDFVITPDTSTLGKPDPITGQIYMNLVAKAGFNPVPQRIPLGATGTNLLDVPLPTPIPALSSLPLTSGGAPASGVTNAYYVFGNTPQITGAESNPPTPVQTLPTAVNSQLPTLTTGAQPVYYWLYLRRPVNPMDPTNTETNPFNTLNPNYAAYYDGKVVVDAFKFMYVESGFSGKVDPVTGQDTQNKAQTKGLFSLQRLQPFRGGHAVASATTANTQMIPPYAYGYSEQTDPANRTSGSYNLLWGTYNYPTKPDVNHTLGAKNDSLDLNWDHLPFFDRDFTSVAELTLVPGCPPGLFTKQFVEMQPPLPNPNYPMGFPSTPYIVAPGSNPPGYPSAAVPFNKTGSTYDYPRTYPYLVDNFFYTAAPDPNLNYNANGTASGPVVGGANSAGWHRMLELVEVPSSANGAIGPVSAGVNLDWYRQDMKPGLLNLNLIIDQEVFLGLLDDPRINTQGDTTSPKVVTQIDSTGLPVTSYSVAGLNGAFSDFLKLRSGGSNYLFGHGAALVGSTPGSSMGSINPAPPTYTPQTWSDRWFHSLSHPDIDLTVMRPAALPPPTIIAGTSNANPMTISTFQTVGSATTNGLSVAQPSVGKPWQFNSGLASSPYWSADPGWKNPYITWALPDPSNVTGQWINPYLSSSVSGVAPLAPQPPPIPPRRLFQIPDYGYPYANTPGATTPPQYWSNASANPSIGAGGTSAGVTSINSIGVDTDPVSTNAILTNQYGDLFSESQFAPGQGYTAPTATAPPYSFLRAGTAAAGGASDQRMHPVYRIEMMQKIMNLTTVRTHQFAVWITVGFFEVVKQGNGSIFAPDQIGPELDLYQGRNVRYRSFFVVDRTKLAGFGDAFFPVDFHDAVVYRRRIQ